MKKWRFGSLVISSFFLTMLGLVACNNDDSAENGKKAKQVEKSSISGNIEKGPFVQGSKVTLYELTADLLQTGKSFKAQTNNDLGAFRFETSMSLGSQFVELESSGYFYNEVQGRLSTSQITLNALSNVENRNSVNVNLITHLEFDRVKNLVREGKTFSDAKHQAEKELLACFAITDEIDSPEGISIIDNDKSSAMLLAISTVMLYNKNEAEFSEFIAKFSTDFADNGKIDNQLIQKAITEGEKNARPNEVIERMKEFYSNKGVTIQGGDFSQYIDFNGDGVIDPNDSISITHERVVEENIWINKNDLQGILSSCYLNSLEFESYQLILEGLRTGDKETVHTITPDNNTLSNTYSSACKVINRVNYLITNIPSLLEHDPTFTNEEMQSYLAEAKCLRAFAYYNLAMLWGRVLIITKPLLSTYNVAEEQLNISPSEQNQVYVFAYNDICEALGQLPTSYATENETKARFTQNAGRMLKAEIELSLGRYDDAKNTLNSAGNTISFGFITQEQSIPVYSPNYLTLLKKEAEGNINGLEEEWGNLTESKYGYWAALKRLGKAQEVTGCFDYELLMPYPYIELRYYPNLTQNPGYEKNLY